MFFVEYKLTIKGWLHKMKSALYFLPAPIERHIDQKNFLADSNNCKPFGRNGGLCFLRYKTLYQYGICDGWGSRSEAAHTFLNLPAWNNESSAYNKIERIVVDYKMRNKRGDLKPNWGYCKHHKVILLCAPPLYINRKVSCFLCSLLIRSHSNRSVDCLATTNHYLVPANDSLTPANHSLVPANNKVLKLAT